MSLVGNGIKSKEAGKSSITTAFTNLFFGIKAIRLKGDLGKRGFVNRSNLKRSHVLQFSLDFLFAGLINL